MGEVDLLTKGIIFVILRWFIVAKFNFIIVSSTKSYTYIFTYIYIDMKDESKHNFCGPNGRALMFSSIDWMLFNQETVIT